MTKNVRISRFNCLATLACCLPLFIGSVTQAAVIQGQSEGTGLRTQLTLNDLLNSSLIFGQASGSAPTPYDTTDPVVTADLAFSSNVSPADTSLDGSGSTDVINAAAASSVDGFAGDKSANASAEVNNLDMSLFNFDVLGTDLIGAPLILGSTSFMDITANTLQTAAAVNGDYSSFTPSGDFTLEALNISLFGQTLTGSLAASVSENFVLFDNFGIRIVLNERIESCVNDSCSIERNAVRIGFEEAVLADIYADFGTPILDGTLDVSTNAVLNGEILIAGSWAQLQARPDATDVNAPAAASLIGLGLMLLGLQRRYRPFNA